MNEFIEFKRKLIEKHPDLAEMPNWESCDALRRYKREIEILDRGHWKKDISKSDARAAVAVMLMRLESWLNLYQ